jgi:hypothetical protein
MNEQVRGIGEQGARNEAERHEQHEDQEGAHDRRGTLLEDAPGQQHL